MARGCMVEGYDRPSCVHSTPKPGRQVLTEHSRTIQAGTWFCARQTCGGGGCSECRLNMQLRRRVSDLSRCSPSARQAPIGPNIEGNTRTCFAQEGAETKAASVADSASKPRRPSHSLVFADVCLNSRIREQHTRRNCIALNIRRRRHGMRH
jgi:hypothetical protein